MKDAFGNEYIKPAACSHPGCPPWKCMVLDLDRLEALPPESPYIRNLSPEQRDRIQRDWDDRNRALEAHRKKHEARRLVLCAILASLPGLGLFLTLREDVASGSTINNAFVAMFVSLFVLGFLYPLSLILIEIPPAPGTNARRHSDSR